MEDAPKEQLIEDNSGIILKQSAFKLIINQCWPTILSYLIVIIYQISSLYYQQAYVLHDNPIAFCILFAAQQITNGFGIGIWVLLSQLLSQALFSNDLESAQTLNQIALTISFYWTIIGFIIFYPICALVSNIFSVPSSLFSQLYTSIGLTIPFLVMSQGQTLRYVAEDRILMSFSVMIIFSVLSFSIESFLYVVFEPNSTWPTTFVFIFSNLLIAIWTGLWNAKFTVLGIINQSVIPTIFKDIFSFTQMKKSIKSILQFVLTTMMLTILKISFPVGIYLAATLAIQDKQSIDQGYKLLIFSVFGQIFRIVPQAISSFLGKVTLICIKEAKHKRLNELILKSVLLCLIFNIVFLLILAKLPILQIFFPKNSQIPSIEVPILYAGIAGIGQILTEVAITLAIAHSHNIIIGVIGILKLIQEIANYFLTIQFVGATDDYYKIVLYGELNSSITGFAVVIFYTLQFMKKSKNEVDNTYKKHKKSK